MEYPGINEYLTLERFKEIHINWLIGSFWLLLANLGILHRHEAFIFDAYIFFEFPAKDERVI